MAPPSRPSARPRTSPSARSTAGADASAACRRPASPASGTSSARTRACGARSPRCGRRSAHRRRPGGTMAPRHAGPRCPDRPFRRPASGAATPRSDAMPASGPRPDTRTTGNGAGSTGPRRCGRRSWRPRGGRDRWADPARAIPARRHRPAGVNQARWRGQNRRRAAKTRSEKGLPCPTSTRRPPSIAARMIVLAPSPMEEAARQAHDAPLEPLAGHEGETLIRLMTTITAAHQPRPGGDGVAI